MGCSGKPGSEFLLEHRNDVAPFYLQVMLLAPHMEHCEDAYGGRPPPEDSFARRIRPAPEDATAVVPAFAPGPAYDEDLADKPSWLSGLPPLTATDHANIAEQYQGRLRAALSTDRMIGRIVAALGSAIDDTVLIFTSDNGWHYGDHRRSEKVYAYDEAARVPLYVALPGSQTHEERSSIVLNNDLAPTIMALASPGYEDSDFDGRSLVPLLDDPTPPGWTDRLQFLVEYGRTHPAAEHDLYPTYAALRRLDTLYIESYDGLYYEPARPLIGLELYDLPNDPAEISSLMHYPEDERHPEFGPWLDVLVTCAGESCAQYENAEADSRPAEVQETARPPSPIEGLLTPGAA
jgi:arylsulfatase A-like enzyme